MAVVKPFNGLTYSAKAGELDTLVCPPYDIISPPQREELVKKNQYNMVRLELPSGGDERYKEAGKLLKEWLENGILEKSEKPCLYAYEMEFSVHGETKKVKGFTAIVRLEEFSAGVVLPHEETLSKAKADRFNLMQETYCNFSQIYALYMDEDGKAFKTIDNATTDVNAKQVTDDDGVIHRIWTIESPTVHTEIEKIFADKKLYIADGHHRYETALKFNKECCGGGEGYIMMNLVNMENAGLVVLPTHRIVRGLDGFSLSETLKKCEEYFSVTEETKAENAQKALETAYKQGKKAYALYSEHKYNVLVMKDTVKISDFVNASEAYCGLDVTVLHSLVLERLFGIDKENMASQINLTYTKTAEEAVETVNSGKANCAFILNPTRVSEIRDVSLAREKMPQKSTYFYPKMVTGLVARAIDN
jgi:uncharacterized protein (DUF1015 family)